MHKKKEKIIHDTWVMGCGIKIKVLPVQTTDNGAILTYDNDPMQIDVNYLSYDEGTIKGYGEQIERYAILLDEQYEQTPISHEIMLQEQNGDTDIQNHNEIYCYINGGIIPKYSLIEFSMYGDIKMRVEEITKKRPQTDIRVYRLTRG